MTKKAPSQKVILFATLLVSVASFLVVPWTSAQAEKAGKTLSGNYLAGRFAQSRSDYSRAADFLGAALKKAPAVPELLRRTFILMAIEGRIKEASGLAPELLKTNPQEAVANLLLMVDDLKRGRFEAVEKRIQGMPATGLNLIVGPVLHAWSLVGRKQNDDALKLLTGGKKSAATEALNQMHAALINELLGNTEAAEKHYLELSNNQSGLSLRIVQLLGALYERTGKTEKAKALYDRYLKEQPGTQLLDVALARLKKDKGAPLRVFSVTDGAAEALFGIASSLRQQNARETALVLSRLALHLKPNFPVMQILLADILESDERLEAALTIYSAISKKSAFSWSARLRIGSLLNRLKRKDEAVKKLETMARDRPSEAGPLINLGDILRGHERFGDAVKAYDQAFDRIGQLEKRHWSLLYARGIALERSGQWPRAEADFLRALEFKPDQPYVLNYLGYSWIEKGLQIERAQEMILKAVKQRPNDGFILDSLGWGHYRLGNYGPAVEYLERAVELRAQDPILNDHLGDAYWRVGRHREARFQWKRALSFKPKDDLIAIIREKLKSGLATDIDTAKNKKNDG
ncbi:MAG: tetratricopeptide repeat protein [Rhodospirillales bacterium]